MVSLVWTRRNIFGSRLIRKITGGNSSHFSVVFDGKVVFESTMTHGCRPCFYSNFSKRNEVVYRIDIHYIGLEKEELVWAECSKMDGAPYDYFGALKLGLRRLFKKDSNDERSNNNRAKFCVEVARSLSPIVDMSDICLASVCPDKLYFYLKGKLDGNHLL